MRNRQGVTIAALIIAIVGLSIGFAAFSNTLTIRSSASVTPDESNFSVVFSTNASTLETNPVTPSSATLGENGTINNRAGNPRLTGLKAKFTEPGQSVVYNLYVLNNGQYDAYLTNIEFTEVETGKTVKCTSGSGATDALTQLACQDINIKLELGTSPNSQEFTPANDGALSTARLLSKNTSEPVKITITYADNGHYVDGPVTVSFGDILLLYRSTSSSVANIPVPEEDTSEDYLMDSTGTILRYLGSDTEVVIPNQLYSTTFTLNFDDEACKEASEEETEEAKVSACQEEKAGIIDVLSMYALYPEYLPSYATISTSKSANKTNVTAIGDSAFRGMGIQSITIPDTVTSIGGNAFQNNSLTNIIIPSSVTELGAKVFLGNNVRHVDIYASKSVLSSSFGEDTFGYDSNANCTNEIQDDYASNTCITWVNG